MGVTAAILRTAGTLPDSREELIILTMVEQRMGRQVLTRAEGMGSREQVVALAFETSLVTCVTSTGAKEERQH